MQSVIFHWKLGTGKMTHLWFGYDSDPEPLPFGERTCSADLQLCEFNGVLVPGMVVTQAFQKLFKMESADNEVLKIYCFKFNSIYI